MEKVKEFDFPKVFESGILPKYFNFMTDVFDYHAEVRPNELALWMEKGEKAQKWTFSELKNESILVSIALKRTLALEKEFNSINDIKIPENCMIFVLLPRVPQWWFTYMAILRIGAVFVPSSIRLSPEIIAFRLNDSSKLILYSYASLKSCKPSFILTDEEHVWKIEEAFKLISNSYNFQEVTKVVLSSNNKENGNLAKNTETIDKDSWTPYESFIENSVKKEDVNSFKNTLTPSEQLSQLFFTSGTTGIPKMVGHQHSSYGIGHYFTTKVGGIRAGDVYWNIADTGWTKSSFGNFYAPWIAGATVYINQMETFEPKKVLEILQTRPINGFCAAPIYFKSFIQEKNLSELKFKALRYCITGGEALPSEIVKVWKDKTGFLLQDPYGQTETTDSIGYWPSDFDRKDDSIGKLILGYEYRITDDFGNELPTGQMGNLAIKIKPKRPIGLFKGYFKEVNNGLVLDTTHKSFQGDFFLSGDIGRVDSDGHFYYCGRSDDIIETMGERVASAEIESVLQKHPSVVENAVVQSPDDTFGAVVKAFIVLSDEYKDKNKEEIKFDIANHCKNSLDSIRVPKKIEFIESLPKTISGKVLRRILKNYEYPKPGVDKITE